MLILLDENLPHRLRSLLPGHDVRTTAYQGWSGLMNGALLRAADQASFDLLLTADQGIKYQQNLSSVRLAIVVLSSNDEALLKAGIQKIESAIAAVKPSTVTSVEL